MAEVQKSAFSLSSATLMVGRAFVDDVFALTPDKHSVGMAQEIRVSVDSSRNELANGVAQSVVDSRKTNVRPSITGNVFEYTAQNFLRAQGLSRAALQPRRGKLTAQVTTGATSLTIVSDPIPGDPLSAITADLPSGSVLLIQLPDSDLVFPTKSTGVSVSGTVPIAGNFAIPAGMTFPVGSRVWVVDEIPVGLITDDDLFCVKVVGTLSNFDRPVVWVSPKVRMVNGFQIGFSETQYGSMPWELSPQLLSRGEAASFPRLSEIGTKRTGLAYVAAGGNDPGTSIPANALSLDGTEATVLSLDGTDATILTL